MKICKLIICVLTLFSLAMETNGQEAYHSVFDDNLRLKYSGISIQPTIDWINKNDMTEDDICTQFVERLYLLGTKEKNGKIYHNLFVYRDRVDCGVILPEELWYMINYPRGLTDLHLGIREDDGRIYMDKEEYLTLISEGSFWHNIADDTYIPYPETEDGELVLYDFTKQKGDMYCSVEGHDPVYVAETETVVTKDNMMRKKQTLSNGYVLIEGLGCINSTGMFLYYLNPRTILSNDNVPYFDYTLMTGATINNDETLIFGQPFWDMVRAVVADGIKEIRVEDKDDKQIYLPDGRMTDTPPSGGIYIRNGRKYVK